MNERLMKLFNWERNPFTFQIIPELFVGYEKEMNKIVEGLNNGDKFSLLIGPTGSGKTTMLKNLLKRFSNCKHVIYLSKPPKDPKDWVTVFDPVIKRGFFSFFSRKKVNLYNLSDVLNKKLNGSKCLLFIDECHEASLDSLEWLRTLTDQVDNMMVVLAGLHIFENTLKNNLETFLKRISTKIELTNLTKSETRELIKRRIESVGGDDIKPFTHDILDYIYEKTGGFPREIIRVCDELIKTAVDKNISVIDSDFINEIAFPEMRVSLEKITTLPDRQREILETLSHHGELTPAEIIERMPTDGYKDRENAIRSVNNLLRRLMKDGFVERKKVGKAYKYKLVDKYKTLLVNA